MSAVVLPSARAAFTSGHVIISNSTRGSDSAFLTPVLAGVCASNGAVDNTSTETHAISRFMSSSLPLGFRFSQHQQRERVVERLAAFRVGADLEGDSLENSARPRGRGTERGTRCANVESRPGGSTPRPVFHPSRERLVPNVRNYRTLCSVVSCQEAAVWNR